MSDLVDEFLAHYGVMGMKWGKRRGASKINSSSSDSRIHFSNSETGETSKGKYPKNSSSQHVLVRELKNKKMHEMSNQELQAVISRMNLEQQYAKINPSTRSRGVKTTNKILGKVGDTVLNRIVKTTVDTAFERVGFKK